MNSVFDIYTIIFLVLAVFIFLRLRSVLGTRTGQERPPADPYSRREATPPGPASNENVLTLPPRTAESRPPMVAAHPLAAGDASPHGLEAIVAADPTFNAEAFLQGAKAAYEMIVTAFAKGDRRALRDLLGRDVYDGFAAAITEREANGHTVDTTFVSIDKVEVADAEVLGQATQITLRLVSQVVTAVHDKAGALVDGSPDKVVEVNDLWTFAHQIGARDPNWTLVATEAQ